MLLTLGLLEFRRVSAPQAAGVSVTLDVGKGQGQSLGHMGLSGLGFSSHGKDKSHSFWAPLGARGSPHLWGLHGPIVLLRQG